MEQNDETDPQFVSFTKSEPLPKTSSSLGHFILKVNAPYGFAVGGLDCWNSSLTSQLNKWPFFPSFRNGGCKQKSSGTVL